MFPAFYNMKNQFWAVGCRLGWTVKKKGLGRLWATFEAHFFTFWGAKKMFKKLHNTFSYDLKKNYPEKVKKTHVFRAKNLGVNTWRSGPDICSLICGRNTTWEMNWVKKSEVVVSQCTNYTKLQFDKISYGVQLKE